MLICFIFLFYLLQFVQSSGFGPSETIPDNAEAQISNSPLGFSEADSQILSVNIIMKSEATPFIAPIENQLVEVFWQMVVEPTWTRAARVLEILGLIARD